MTFSWEHLSLCVCRFKLKVLVNYFWHWIHTKSSLQLSFFTWRFKWDFVLNDLLHWGHFKFLGPCSGNFMLHVSDIVKFIYKFSITWFTKKFTSLDQESVLSLITSLTLLLLDLFSLFWNLVSLTIKWTFFWCCFSFCTKMKVIDILNLK